MVFFIFQGNLYIYIYTSDSIAITVYIHTAVEMIPNLRNGDNAQVAFFFQDLPLKNTFSGEKDKKLHIRLLLTNDLCFNSLPKHNVKCTLY